MMLTMSTRLKKYFHFANCHGYLDINPEKEKIGFISKHDFSTKNHKKSSRQLVILKLKTLSRR